MSQENNQRKSGTKTLFWSVLMSAPGPLIIGLGLGNLGGVIAASAGLCFRKQR